MTRLLSQHAKAAHVLRAVGSVITLRSARTVTGRVNAAGFPVARPRASMALALFAAMTLSSVASAFTAPSSGDFGYDVYDIVVNQILNGPIGFIGGVALIVFGATQIMKNWFSTILCIIAGTVLIRAESLVVTLGYNVV